MSEERKFLKRGPAVRFPQIEEMGAGTQLDITLAEKKDLQLIRNSVQYIQRTRGRKYTTKKMNDAVRIWRLV